MTHQLQSCLHGEIEDWHLDPLLTTVFPEVATLLLVGGADDSAGTKTQSARDAALKYNGFARIGRPKRARPIAEHLRAIGNGLVV